MSAVTLELLDKLVASSGVRLARILDVLPGSGARERQDAESEAQVVTASGASWLSSVQPRRVVFCEYPDGSVQEWRIAFDERH